MQMTMDAALCPGLLQAFALKKGSGYVMRSEKRPGYGGGGSPNHRNGRKPKRPKAGIFYILLTLLMCVLLWPVGLVMLWARKVRMQPGTKLLISLLTLCVSVFLIVFTLTVPVDNPKFTEFQDKANDWLNRAAADVAVAGDAAYKQGTETWGVMKEFANNAIGPAANTLAEGLDKGVELATRLRSKIENRPESDLVTDKPTEVDVDVTSSPEAENAALEVRIPVNTPNPDTALPLTAGLLNARGDFTADQTPEPTATPAPTPESAADDSEAEPAAEPAQDGIVWSDADAEPSDTDADVIPKGAPSDAPEATPISEIAVKPAKDATVYYNKNGRLYHMRSSCKNMKKAPAHTLAEALEAGKQKCTACGAPDPSLLEIEHVAWVDGKKVYHVTDECSSFNGNWTLISLENAINGKYTACPDCGADVYTALYLDPDGIPEPTEAPTPDPTEAPTEAPTEIPEETPTEAPETEPKAAPAEEEDEALAEDDETPAEEASPAPTGTPEPTNTPDPTETPEPTPEPVRTVSPAVPLKAAGDATVYHSSNGKFYHRFNVCKGMTGSNPYKLSEITSKYRRCTRCNPPDIALVGETCLWEDENGLCHTADTCEKFSGDYTLILRDEALAQGKEGCPDCGADEYLIPNTVLGEVEPEEAAADEAETEEAPEAAE